MPIEIPTRFTDEDLAILDTMSNEELKVLVTIIVDKGKLTQRLTSDKRYKKFYPEHRKYTDLIAKELLAFGSHTFYFNKNYREIVRDVCDKLEVSHDKTHDLRQLEKNLLSKVLEQSWESMSDEERQDLLNVVGEKSTSIASASFDVLKKLFFAGGKPSVLLASSIVGSIGEAILGSPFTSIAASTGGALLIESATSFAMTRAASLLTGPIGIALTTAFTLKALGGPAYRVTVPAVIYIAGIRMLRAESCSTATYASLPTKSL